jgi:hypothetical protein
MTEQQRCEMCQAAFDAATQAAERKLVLDVLKRYRNLGSLQLAAKITREAPDLNKQATQATLAIARELGDEKHSGTADEVRDIVAHAKLGKVKLEIVKAEFGAAGKQKQLVGDVQFIKLPAPNYVAAFGGDPVPGTVKQLKIQYRIDGKSGEASFVENALIILPTP